MSIRILHGDCRDMLKTLADASVDSIVTDPPYHLTNTKGGTGVASINLNTPYGRARIGTEGNGGGNRGFMGLKWDGGDIAQDPAVWAECLRVLKPGGYLLAFSGTRTQHRMVCAIEDAGFEIRDQIGWAYGSGFPKSHNGEWGGTALKPAWEPICMARKPLIGTVEANWREYGTGALNIDACRVAVTDAAYTRNMSGDRGHDGTRSADDTGATNMRPGGGKAADGRWPANLIHDGSDEVVAAFPSEAGAQAPVTVRNGDKFRGTYGAFKGNRDEQGSTFQGDNGSAARFFYCAKADRADRNEGLHGMPTKDLNWSSGTQSPGTFQSANTNRAVQNHHPTVKPTDLMRYLCRLVTPKGGVVLDPFMGSGSTLKAAELEGFSAIGIELSAEYIEIARRRIGADAPLFAEVTA